MSPTNQDLERAIRHADDGAAIAALQRGADPNLVGDDQIPLIIVAARDGRRDVVAAMVSAGVDDDLRDATLGPAASAARIEVVEMLLELGARPTYRFRDGSTALHFAASSPSPEVARALLRAGAEVDARRYDGSTAMLIAAQNGYPRTVQALLDAGADVNAVNTAGQSAIDWAVAGKQDDLLAVLRAKGATGNGGVSLDDLTDSRGCRLEVFTTGVMTDGRHLKIRGTTLNLCSERVVGIRYRVSMIDQSSGRILDRMQREVDTEIEASGRKAMALDYATMYAGAAKSTFMVEAFPMQLGDKLLAPPADW